MGGAMVKDDHKPRYLRALKCAPAEEYVADMVAYFPSTPPKPGKARVYRLAVILADTNEIEVGRLVTTAACFRGRVSLRLVRRASLRCGIPGRGDVCGA
jgi:hypothetical protein